jgi:hypothetical protein
MLNKINVQKIKTTTKAMLQMYKIDIEVLKKADEQ